MPDEINKTGYPNKPLDQTEFMKRMRAIASDLWSGREPLDPAAPASSEPSSAAPAAQAPKKQNPPARPKAPTIDNLWKVADETVDWTDALAHETPTDGLTSLNLWSFYHRHAEKVLEGDLNSYAEVLRVSNPLGELTEFAEGITIRAPEASRLICLFTGKQAHMEKDGKKYLSAMGVRIARDLLACLPVSEVDVQASWQGKTVMQVTYARENLMHKNFEFLDPVAFTEACGAKFDV